MKRLKKIVRFSLKAVAVILLLFLILWGLIQLPTVQNYLVQEITHQLSKKLKTKVRVERVDLDFFKTVVLENILIEDQQQDTLLAAQKIGGNIQIFSLFGKELKLKDIYIENAVSHLHTLPNSDTLNFQFIIDAFESNDKSNKPPAFPWNLGIKTLRLENIDFSYEESGSFALKTFVPDLEIQTKLLDLKQKKLELEKLELENSSLEITLFESDNLDQQETPNLLKFPKIGWQIQAEEITLNNNLISISRPDQTELKTGMDFNHLGFEGSNIYLKNLIWSDSLISSEIQQVSFLEKSGLQLKALKGNVEIRPELIAAEYLTIETNKSKIHSNTTLTFKNFDNLTSFLDKVNVNSEFEKSSISFQELKLITGTSWPEFLTQHGVVKLSGDIKLKANQFSSRGLSLHLPDNQRLLLSGTISDVVGKGKLDLDIKKLISSYQGITSLTHGFLIPDYLELLGQFDLKGKIKGTFDDLEVTNFELNTESANHLNADFNLKNLKDFENSNFSFDFKNLTLTPDLLHSIAGKPSTTIFENLGIIQFQGKVVGTPKDISVLGDMQAAPGNIQSNLKMNFSDHYQNADYSVSLDFENWDIEKLSNNIPIKTSGNLSLEGSGLRLDDLDLKWESEVNSLLTNGYEYQNINFSGDWKDRQINVDGKVDDEHFKTIFESKVLLNDSLPELKFLAQTDTLNFHKLNWSQEPLSWSGSIDLDITGDALDEIIGSLKIENWSLSNDSSTVQSDVLLLESNRLNSKEKELLLKSDFISANIKGDYHIATIKNLGIQFMDAYFPVSLSFEKGDSSISEINLKDREFVFNIETKDCSDLLQIIDTGWVSWEPSFVKGKFDSQSKLLEIDGNFPGMEWGQYKVDSLLITTHSNLNSLNSTIIINSIKTGDFLIPESQFQMDFADNKLLFQLDLEKEQSKKLVLGGAIESLSEGYFLHFQKALTINDSTWTINPLNSFEWYEKTFSVKDFNMFKGAQKINLRTLPIEEQGQQAPLEIQIANFSLALLPNIIEYSGDDLDGFINGDIQISGLPSNPVFQGDMNIKDLKINNQDVGNFSLNAKQKTKDNSLIFNLNLTGKGNEINGEGVYRLETNLIEADINFDRLNASLAEIVAGENIDKTSGEITGKLNIQGSLSNPLINGNLSTKKISTLLKVADERYTIPESQISFSKNKIDLGQFTVKDEAERLLKVQGAINYKKLQNFMLDLQFESDEIQVLNTKYNPDELYYGNLLVNTSGTVTGPFERLQIKVDATTLPGSALNVLPATQEDILLGGQVIVFGHPDSLTATGEIETRTEIPNPYNFDLSASLEVTPATILTIELDPNSGDQVVCNGKANLVVDMDATGNLEIIGDYIFDKGKYNFNYEGLVKKEFEIQKGSSLTFPGDPYKAGFGLTAIYRIKTSTVALIETQSTLSDDELKEARKSTEVLVLMHINGNLEEPQLSFEIKIPEMEDGTIGGAVSRRLGQLNENPDELNKQVFGLLFFNSFFASQEGVAVESLSNSIESAAFASLRSFMTGQLNSLANKYVKGFEIEFAMDTYNAGAIEGSAGVVSEFGVSISKQLFDERLTMQVGSNFNVTRDDVTSWSNSDFTSLAGDFILEYKLTKEGNYLLRVFHLSDYDILEGENNYETGVSFVLRKKLKNKKRKNKKSKTKK